MSFFNSSNRDSSKSVSWTQAKEMAKRGEVKQVGVYHNGRMYSIDLTNKSNPELDTEAKMEMARAFFNAISK